MKNPTLLKKCYIIAEEMKCPTILIPFGINKWRRFANWHSADLNFEFGFLNKLVELGVC